MPDGKEDFESWVITSPVDPSQVIPDYGTLIKSYSEVVPGFYDYTYYKPGKFTVTVVSRNATGVPDSAFDFISQLDLYPKSPSKMPW